MFNTMIGARVNADAAPPHVPSMFYVKVMDVTFLGLYDRIIFFFRQISLYLD